MKIIYGLALLALVGITSPASGQECKTVTREAGEARLPANIEKRELTADERASFVEVYNAIEPVSDLRPDAVVAYGIPGGYFVVGYIDGCTILTLSVPAGMLEALLGRQS